MSVLIVILLLHAAAAILIVLTLGIKMRPEKQVIRSRRATTTDQEHGGEDKLKEATDEKDGSPETPASETPTAPAKVDEKDEAAGQTLAVPPLEPIELRTEPLPLQPPPREADPMPANEDATPAAAASSETLQESSVTVASHAASSEVSTPESTESEIPRSEGISPEVHNGPASSGPSASDNPPMPSSGPAAPSSYSWDAVTSVESGGPAPEVDTSPPASQPEDDAGPITHASPLTAASSASAQATEADSLGATSTTEPPSSAASPLRSPSSSWARSSVSPVTSEVGEARSPGTTEPTGSGGGSESEAQTSPENTQVPSAVSSAPPVDQQKETPQEPSVSPRVNDLRERIREQIPGAGTPAKTASTQVGPSVPTNETARADSSPSPPPFFDLDAKPAEEAATSRSFWGSKTEPAAPTSPPETSEDIQAKLEALLRPKADPGRTRESAGQGSATSAYEAASRVETVRKPIDTLVPEVIPRGVKVSKWRGGMPLGMGRSITRLILAIMLFSVVLSLLAVLAVSWLGSIMRGIAG